MNSGGLGEKVVWQESVFPRLKNKRKIYVSERNGESLGSKLKSPGGPPRQTWSFCAVWSASYVFQETKWAAKPRHLREKERHHILQGAKRRFSSRKQHKDGSWPFLSYRRKDWRVRCRGEIRGLLRGRSKGQTRLSFHFLRGRAGENGGEGEPIRWRRGLHWNRKSEVYSSGVSVLWFSQVETCSWFE